MLINFIMGDDTLPTLSQGTIDMLHDQFYEKEIYFNSAYVQDDDKETVMDYQQPFDKEAFNQICFNAVDADKAMIEAIHRDTKWEPPKPPTPVPQPTASKK